MPLLRSRAFSRRANSYFFSATIAAFAGSREVESIAQIIDGKAIANSIRAEIKTNVKTLNEMYGRAPGLAVVLVGARKDSQTYVRMKKRACEAAGIASFENIHVFFLLLAYSALFYCPLSTVIFVLFY